MNMHENGLKIHSKENSKKKQYWLICPFKSLILILEIEGNIHIHWAFLVRVCLPFNTLPNFNC